MSLRDVLTEGIDHWLTISVVPYFSLDVLLVKNQSLIYCASFWITVNELSLTKFLFFLRITDFVMSDIHVVQYKD